MIVNPLVACSKLGGICLSLLTKTVVTTFLFVDTAFEISQRVYCVFLLNKKKRQELLQEWQIKSLSGQRLKQISSDVDIVNLASRKVQFAEKLRKSKSYDSKLAGLAGFAAQDYFHPDGEGAVLISYRSSSISSDTFTTRELQNCGQQSSESSPASETSELQSQEDSSLQMSPYSRGLSPLRRSFKGSFSQHSRINEDEETERYIEELQNQVSSLMYESSLVQQLQQRVQDLEKQRDLLTKELLDTPKDIISENESLKSQLKNQYLQHQKTM